MISFVVEVTFKEDFSWEKQKIYYYQFCDFCDFQLKYLYTLLFALNGTTHVKYEKNLCLFLYLFHNTGLNLAQILPQDHTHFEFFFAGFQ